MLFNFKDTYCQRVFMLEAEESARHLEWMKLVLGGGKSAASDKGYYDGRGLNIGYIVDRSDPKRKKYIVYEPHAEKVRWLFRRFLELDGNFTQLCREVDAMPYLFPEFEPGIDTTGFKRKHKKTSEGDWRKPTESGIRGILTNPVYIGWWIPLDGGVIENNHDAIVDEALFVYAHKRLSAYDLNGDRQKPERVTRNGRVNALLKKVVKAPDGYSVYAVDENGGSYRCAEYTGLSKNYRFAILASVVDEAFLEKFFERVCNDLRHEASDWEDRIEKQRAAKEAQLKLIKKGIREAELKMARINELLTDIDNPVPNATSRDNLCKEEER